MLQAALLGVVGLVLAFGLALALDRYESRRAAIVAEANAIGTTYLRAQTLPEPTRSRSLALLTRYTRHRHPAAPRPVPGSPGAKDADADGHQPSQRTLWGLAGRELDAAPTASAPRLYVETLNEMIDSDASRVVRAQQPRADSRAAYWRSPAPPSRWGCSPPTWRSLGRATGAVLLAAGLVTLLLLVTFDLDRPTRGFIRVPATPLTNVRDSMELPPAAGAPREP